MTEVSTDGGDHGVCGAEIAGTGRTGSAGGLGAELLDAGERDDG
jgi:hypothetical protein